MNTSQLLCEKLLQINAIKLSPQNPFTWASGIKSPIYCDNRISLSYPEVRNLVKEGLKKICSQMPSFDVVAGVATAGIAHGALLADLLNVPFAYVRAEAKSHGRKNRIEGDLSACHDILVVEDLISTGGSSLQVVDVLREEGKNVVGVVAIFDYGFEQARQNFLKNNVVCKTITNYDTLIQVANENEYIKEEDVRMLIEWRVDPQNWA